MMEELVDSIVEALNADEELRSHDLAAWCPDRRINGELCAINKDVSAEVFSLGFSQPDGAGALKPYYYLGIVLRASTPIGRNPGEAAHGIDSAAERIVDMLHRKNYAGVNVLFSKAIRLYERHTIELNTRRLTLDVAEGEQVEGIFFYAADLTLTQLESQTPSHGIRLGAGSGGSSSEEGTTVIYMDGDGIWD